MPGRAPERLSRCIKAIVTRRFRFRLPPVQANERRYLIGLGAVLAVVGVGHASAQLWLNYGPDLSRALAWVGGAQELGVNHLQHPVLRQASFPKIAAQQRGMAAAVDQAIEGLELQTLPLAGESVQVQFAGIDLAANGLMTNYLLLNIKQQLLKTKAKQVRIAYPVTTFRLAETAVPDGVASELDQVLMPVRDQQLAAKPVAGERQLLLRVREAGVDTEDLSIYSPDFYVRVTLWSCFGIFVVGGGVFVLLNRRLPAGERRSAVIATALALAFGWNLLMWLFITLRPNQLRLNVISRVDLTAFMQLDDGPFDRRGQGLHEVVVAGSVASSQPLEPVLLGEPKVMTPMEGGFAPLIPPAPVP